MNASPKPVSMDQLPHDRFKDWPCGQDYCITCGICSSSCPVAGVDGFDPRKIVRMVSLGLEKDNCRGALAVDLHHVRQV